MEKPVSSNDGQRGRFTADNIGRTAGRSIGWITLDKWGTRVISLAILVILGRLLKPADFGAIAIATMCVSLAGIFVDQGFGLALVQRRDLRPAHVNAAFWSAIGIAGVLTIALFAGAPAISRLMDAPGLAAIIRWMAIGVLFTAVSGAPAALLERDFRFKSLAIRRLAGTLAGGVAAVIVALAGGGVWSLVAQTIVSSLVSIAVLWSATDWRPRASFEMPAFRELWPIGAGVLGIELVGFANSQADRLLVGVFIGTEALGFYFMAMRIVSIMVELFSSIFSTVSLTVFSRLQDDPPGMRSWLYRLTGASAAVAVPCFAIAALLAPVLLPVVLGNQWSATVPLFQILSLLGAINATAYFDKSVLLATSHARAAFLLSLGQTLLGLALLAVASPYGVVAIAISVVGRQYLYWPIRLLVLKRKVDVDPRAYAGQWLRPFLAALAASVVVYAAVWQWPALTRNSFGYVAGAGASGLVLYLAALFALHGRACADIALTFKSLLRGSGRTAA